ncbi:MAG: WecB/TagA/CpsF family glycosyltransferase [Clostridia bacterium]|nr:WecB/TagA/CpsF family glycosyltransferase [Clostridia bacterium]
MSEKINVRGVYFDNVTLDEAVDMMLCRIKEGKQTAVFTPNPEIVQLCIDDNSMYDEIGKADITLPDGIGIVKAAKILGTPLKGRVPGYEAGEKIISLSASENLKIFFLGGKPGVAELAAEKMGEKYPGTLFVGTHDGYFKKEGEENDEVVRLVNESGADVLFVCLGVPAQEKWINANRDKLTSVKLMLGLGGSLDGYSGTVKRAPKFFIKLNLEWFYRLLCQPSRIGRMMKLPKFYFGTIIWKWKNKKNNK